MKNILRWAGAILSVLFLCAAAFLGLARFAMTGFYAGHALGDEALLARQQSVIDAQAAAFAEGWHFSSEALAPWMANAAATHHTALQGWWHSLWHDEAADPALPVFLSAAEERAMVAALMADEAFAAATPADLLRVTARDDVAYALDETICRSVLPLRRPVADLVLEALCAAIAPTMLRRVCGVGALALLGASIALMLLCRKCLGSILTAAGVAMAMLSLPVWLLNIPQMLDALNPLAEAQGLHALIWLALPWYAASLLLLLAGSIILRARN